MYLNLLENVWFGKFKIINEIIYIKYMIMNNNIYVKETMNI